MSTAARQGGRILVDQLLVHGADLAFCVPGESFLPVLDALYEHRACRAPGELAVRLDHVGRARLVAAGREVACSVEGKQLGSSSDGVGEQGCA